MKAKTNNTISPSDKETQMGKPRLETVFWYALGGVTLGLYLFWHLKASWNFSVPWPDESWFLWPSISFAENNTLFSPELNPARTIMWMPPGYMVIMGTLFKIFGFSFSFARWVSFFFMVGVFVLLATWIKKTGLGIFGLLILSVFYLNRYFIYAGNIARMEALLLLVVIAGYYLLYLGKIWPGLALLGCTPLIHPNGMYFLVAAVVGARLEMGYQDVLHYLKAHWKQAFLLLIPITLWILYGVYILQNLDAFHEDMLYQFFRKSQRNIPYLSLPNLINLAAVIACLSLLIKFKLKGALLLALGTAGKIASLVGQEICYQVHDSLFFLAFALVVMLIAREIITRYRLVVCRQNENFLMGAFCLLLLGSNLYAGRIENPFEYARGIEWCNMSLNKESPFITAGDRKFFADYLQKLASKDGKPITVRFEPEAEALFYAHLRGKPLQFSQPVFCYSEPDVRILHITYSRPDWNFFTLKYELGRADIDTTNTQNLVYERNNTEKWFVILSDRVLINTRKL